MEGLSLRELSEAIKGAVSHAALAKYEKGQMMPDSELLVQICRVLHKSPDFFLRTPKLELKEVRFRKMARLALTHERALMEKARDYFERYSEAEWLVGVEHSFDNPLKKMRVETFEDAEKCARELRNAWHLGNDPIPNVISMLEAKGVKIQIAATEDRHFDGLCSDSSVGPLIVIASWLNANPLRRRMTLIHELGHLLLNLPVNMEEKVEENLISRFAGAFLISAISFKEQFGGHRTAVTLEELIQMKLYYGVSIMAIMMRAKHLGLIPEIAYRRFWTDCGNQWKLEQKEPGDELYALREEPVRFKMLVYRAAAEHKISLSKGAELLGVSLGELRGEVGKVCA